MNKNLYRIVFNKARGLLMVVAEIVTSDGKTAGTTDAPSGSAGGQQVATISPLPFLLMAAFGMVLWVSPLAHAQIVADPNAPGTQQATVLTTSNGRPLVNIQTPSSGGVSRNVYTQFDVDKNGVILNNSRTNTSTQLGGWVQANPWLATGTARIILNEVNASNPSQLKGYIEVAGDRAQVVIANAAGISCDGCGFINASRATLTTGTPQFSGGNLTGYLVQRGQITVGGAGLDASQTDFTDLIARSVQVNAGIWAKNLQVTVGANQVSVDQSQVTQTSGTDAAPAFGIDVSSLGGMYAGKITLVGTEAGVGMRNAGQIGASVGEVVVTADGKLQNVGAITSATDTRITTNGGLSNSGSLYAQGNASVSTQGNVDNSGVIAAVGNTTVSATGAGSQITNHSGALLGAGIQSDGSLATTGNLNVTATGQVTTQGQNLAGGDLSLHGSSLDLSSSQTGAHNITLTATSGDVDANHATVSASQTLAATASQTLRTDSAHVSASQLNLTAHDISNVAGELVQTGTGDTTIAPVGNLDNTSGRIASNGSNLTLGAQTLTNTSGTIEHAGTGTLAVNATTLNGSSGTIGSNGQLKLTAQNATLDHGNTSAQQIQISTATLSNRGGSLIQSGTGATQITATTQLDNTGGTVASNGATTLTVGDLHNQGGTIQSTSTADLTVHATGDIDNSAQGKLSAGGNGIVTANSLNNAHGQLTAGKSLQVATTNAIDNSSGTLAANQTVAITGGDVTNTSGDIHGGNVGLNLTGQLSNTQGQINSSGDLTVSTATGISNSGTLYAHGNANLGTQGNIDNSGVIAAAGNTTLNATGASSQITSHSGATLGAGIQADGSLATTGNLSVTATGQVTAQGQNLAGGDLSLHGSSLDLSTSQTSAHNVTLTATSGDIDANHATVTASQTLTTTAAQTLRTDGGHVSANKLNLAAHDLSNVSGNLTQTGAGDSTIALAGNLDNTSGHIASNSTNLTLGAQTLTNNSGSIAHAGTGTLAITATTLNGTSGTIGSNGQLNLTAQTATLDHGNTSAQQIQISTATLSNRSGNLIQSGTGAAQISATISLDNTGGTLTSNGATTLTVGDLHNQGGTIQSTGTADLTVHATSNIDNSAQGKLSAGGNGTLTAASLNNAHGQLTAGNNLQVTTTNAIDNSSGTLASNQAVVIAAGDLTNANGDIHGGNIGMTLTGQLANTAGQINSSGDLTVNAATGLANSGTLYAHGNANLGTQGNIDNSGVIAAAGNTTLNATGATSQITSHSGATLGAGIQTDGSLASTGNLSVTATGQVTAQGQNLAGGDLSLHGSGLDLSTSQTSAHNVTLTATSGDVDANHATVSASQTLTATAAQTLRTDSAHVSANQLNLAAHDLSNVGGGLTQTGSGDTTIALVGSLDNTSGHIASNGNNLTLGATTLTNANGGQIQHAGSGMLAITATTLNGDHGSIGSNGQLNLTAGAAILDNGTTTAQQLQIQTSTLSNRSGSITQSGTSAAQITATTALDNTGGTVTSNGATTLTVGTLTNQGGTIQSTGTADLTVHATGNIDNSAQGKLSAGGNGIVTANSLNNAHGQLTAGNSLQVATTNAIDNSSGTLAANQAVTLNASDLTNTSGDVHGHGVTATLTGQLSNTQGQINSSGDLTVNTVTGLANSGTLYAHGNANLGTQGNIDNSGVIAAAGNTTLNATGATSQITSHSGAVLGAGIQSDGSLATTGNLSVTATGQITTQGQNLAGGDLSLHGSSLDLSTSQTSAHNITLTATSGNVDANHATVSASQTLTATAAQTLRTDSAHVSANQLNLAAHDLSNVSGNLTQTGSGDSAILLAGNLDNTSGRIASNGNNLTLGAQTLTNSNGTIEHVGTGTLAITATTLNGTHGNIGSNGLLNLTAQTATLDSGSTVAQQLQVNTATLSNRGGSLIQSGTGATQITATTALDNVGGTLASNGATTLTVGDLHNQGGTIQSTGTADLTVHATGNIDNSAQGKLSAGGNGVITAASLNNTHGQLTAGNNLQVTTTNAIDNSSGTLAANQTVAITGGDVTNTSGDIHGHGITATLTGQLSNTQGQINSSGDLTVNTATGISNSGTLYAHGNANLGTQGNIDNSGVIAAAGNTTLNASGATSQITSHSGAILGAGVQTDGSLGSTGNLAVSATKTVTAQGQNLAGGDLSLHGSSLDLSTSQTSAHNVTLTATNGDVDANHATVSASQTLAATTSQTLRTDSAHVSANQLNLAAHDLSNVSGNLTQTGSGDSAILLAGNLDNTSGRIASNGNNLTLGAQTLTNSNGTIEHVGTGTLAITATTLNGTHGNIGSNGLLNLTAQTATLDSGSTVAQQLQVNTATLSNRGGSLIQSGTGATQITATTALDNVGGTLASNGATTLTVGTLTNQGGTIQSTGTADLTVHATGNIDNSAQGKVSAGGNGVITAASLNNTHGQLTASNGLQVTTTNAIDNSSGTLAANQAVTLNAGDLTNTSGDVHGHGVTATLTGQLSNTQGQINSSGDLTVNTATGISNSGTLYAHGNANLGTQGNVDNSGVIAAAGNTTLNATGATSQITSHSGAILGAGVQTDGSLGSTGNLTVSATKTVTAQGQNLAGGDLSLQGSSLDLSSSQTGAHNVTLTATSGDVDANHAAVSASQTLTATAAQTLRTDSAHVSANQLNLTAHDVSNAGGSLIQTGSGATTITPVGNLDNHGGVIATAGALTLAGTTIDNSSQGQIQAARVQLSGTDLNNASGAIVQTGTQSSSFALTGQLNNTGGRIGSNGQDLTLTAAQILNNQGTIAHSGTGTLTLGDANSPAAIDNTQGQIGSNGNIRLNASTLGNAGGQVVASNGNLDIHATQNISNVGGTLAAGHALSLVGSGALNNQDGDIEGSSLTLDAASLSNAGAGRVLALNGDAQLTVHGTLANAGTIGGKGVVNVQAVELDNSGALSSTHELTVGAGRIVNSGTLVSDTTLTLNAQNDITNDHGKAQGAQVVLAANSLSNAGGQIVQTGSADDAWTFSGGVNNQSGVISSNAHNLTLSAAQVQNNAGHIDHVGTGTLNITAGAIDNTGGAIGGNGDVTLATNTLTNTAGQVTAQNNLNAAVASTLTNTGGSLSAVHGAINITGNSAVDNTGGTIEAATTLALNARTLTNATSNGNGGRIDALAGNATVSTTDRIDNSGLIGSNADVTLTTTHLSNSGTLSAAHSLALTAQDVTNSGQVLGNDINAQLTASLNNAGGTFSAGNSLTVNAASITNTGGTLSNSGTGLTQVTTSGTLDNTQGLIGGNGNVQVSAAQLTNAQGKLIAGGTLAATSSGLLDNSAGTINATGDITLTANQFTNTNGHLDTRGNVTLAISQLGNSSGNITANGDVAFNATSSSLSNLLGDLGAVAAGNNLTLNLQGDVQFGASNWTANHGLTVKTNGAFSNYGKLGAVGVFELDSTSFYNASNAQLSGNQGLVLNTTGGITNDGVLFGDTVQINAASLTNNNAIYGGDVSATANTLVNQNGAVIAAGRSLQLYGSNISNTGGSTMYSVGNLTLAGLSGANAATVLNQSSTIQGDGNVSIYADHLDNKRTVLNVVTTTLPTQTTTTNLGTTVVSINSGLGERDTTTTQITTTDITQTALVGQDSPAAQILAGGNLLLTGSVNNDASLISAGGQFLFNANIVTNTSYNLGQVQTDTVVQHQVITVHACGANNGGCGSTTSTTDSAPVTTTTTTSTGGYSAILSAGQSINGNATSINNVTVGLAPNATNGTTVSVGGKVTYTSTTVGTPADLAAATSSLPLVGTGTGTVGQTAANAHAPTLVSANTTAAATTTSIAAAAAQPQANIGPELGPSPTSNVASASTINSVMAAPSARPTDLAAVVGPTLPSATTSATVTTAVSHDAAVGPTDIAAAQGTAVSNTMSSASPIKAVRANALLAADDLPQTPELALPTRTSVTTPTVSRIGPTVSRSLASLSFAVGPAGLHFQLPTSALFHINTGPNQRYLVETDPRFTQYSNFISSDYMLQLMKLDPATAQKRLGDAFYENQLITDQIGQLTGKRFLDGYASQEAEYRALMNAGAAYGQQFNLRPGVSLTAAQMASLTTDMVWLESRNIDGQDVLVPVVYLANVTQAAMQTGLAQINAKSIDLTVQNGLTNSGLITTQAGTKITAGQISNLGGSITSQGDLKLAASAGDLLNQAGTLSGKNVTLSATGNLLDLSQAVTANANQSADPNAIRLASIKADGNLIMQAGQDLTVTAGQISATGDASLHAARNLTLDTLATSSTTTQLGTNLNNGWFAHDGTVSTASQTTQHVTGLNIGGNTVLTAGQDATLTGAQVQSAQKITLAAGGNVTVQAALEKTSSDVQNGDRYHAAQSDDHLLGSTLHAGTDLIVAAGQNGDATKPGNLTITSSNVTSDKGPVQLVATGNVVLGTQTETHTTFLETRKDIGGILSSGESHDRNTSTTTLAIGSTVSGDSVVVTAGKDLTVTGSGIAASKDLALTAGNQLTIQAATNTETTSHLHEEHQSGLTGMSLTQISIGTRSEKDTADTAGTTQSQSRSTVGSVGGNVTLVAGKDVNVLGSDLIVGQAKNDLTGATGNLLLQGQNVHIDSGADSQQSKNTYESRQVGITATLGGVAGQFVQAAEQATKAQEQGDDRLTALYATKAGLTAYNAVTGPATAGGVPSSMFKVSVSVGASSSSSDSTSQTLVHQGSTLTAGNDVHLIATGSGSKDAQGNATDGDLIARGVQISGKNVSVSAARDIDLLSATDTAKTDSHNDSSSASIGVGFSMGGQQNGFTLELAAAKANGFSNGNGTTNQNSQITATDTLTLQSGRDANLIGAQARGNKVETDIGRDLNVISLQDTDTYRAKQDSSGFNASVCVPPFCYGTTVSASVSVGKGKTNSDYQSVGQQTGLYAGSDGYDIKVKNNTNLTGAVIASAADASKNSLSTGTLTTGNLQNHAEYDSSNTNISLSANIGTSAVNAVAPSLTSNLTDNLTANLANLSKPKLSGDADGTTKSAISAGTVTITDDAKQKELTGKNATDTVASLNRDTASANGNIGKIFDLKTIQREQEVQTALASVAQEVQVTMNNLASKADAKNQLAKDKETQALDPSLTADQRTQLINDAAQLKQDAAAWAPGGTNRQIVTAVLAAATSDPMGSAGQLVRDAAVSYLQQQTVAQVKTIADAYLDAQGHPTATSEAMRTALQTIVGCAGAAASSQHNCGDGATGAAASVVINNLLDKVSDTDAEHMTAAEKEQRIQLVQALAGGIAVAAKSKNIATVVNSAQMETENNALAMKAADLMKSARSCSGSTGAAQSSCFNGAIDQAKKDSKVTNARLAAACTGPEADLTSCKAQLTQIETGNLYLTESLIYAKTPEQEAALIQLAKAQVTDVANLRSQINTLENNADAWDHAFAGATQQMLDVTNSLLISHGLKTIEPPTVTPTRKTTLNDNLKPDQPELTASFSTGQLDKKFKHADDFGVITTKKNPDTLAQYQAALEKHLNDPTTQPKGTYGFVPDSVVYFNPNTNNVVVLKSTGEFVTGWKLDPQSAQYQNFIKNGVLR